MFSHAQLFAPAAPHSHAAAGVVLYLCIIDQNSPTLVRRRLSLIQIGLGKDIPVGTKLTSAINEWSREVFSGHPKFYL